MRLAQNDLICDINSILRLQLAKSASFRSRRVREAAARWAECLIRFRDALIILHHQIAPDSSCVDQFKRYGATNSPKPPQIKPRIAPAITSRG